MGRLSQEVGGLCDHKCAPQTTAAGAPNTCPSWLLTCSERATNTRGTASKRSRFAWMAAWMSAGSERNSKGSSVRRTTGRPAACHQRHSAVASRWRAAREAASASRSASGSTACRYTRTAATCSHLVRRPLHATHLTTPVVADLHTNAKPGGRSKRTPHMAAPAPSAAVCRAATVAQREPAPLLSTSPMACRRSESTAMRRSGAQPARVRAKHASPLAGRMRWAWNTSASARLCTHATSRPVTRQRTVSSSAPLVQSVAPALSAVTTRSVRCSTQSQTYTSCETPPASCVASSRTHTGARHNRSRLSGPKPGMTNMAAPRSATKTRGRGSPGCTSKAAYACTAGDGSAAPSGAATEACAEAVAAAATAPGTVPAASGSSSGGPPTGRPTSPSCTMAARATSAADALVQSLVQAACAAAATSQHEQCCTQNMKARWQPSACRAMRWPQPGSRQMPNHTLVHRSSSADAGARDGSVIKRYSAVSGIDHMQKPGKSSGSLRR
jgi:hypothetical protein